MDLGFNTGTLLTGNLSQFGFDGVDYPFEFYFHITGGDAAPLYGKGWIPGGIVIFDTGFPGDFTQDFSSNIATVM